MGSREAAAACPSRPQAVLGRRCVPRLTPHLSRRAPHSAERPSSLWFPRCAALVQAGYVGEDVESILYKLYQSGGWVGGELFLVGFSGWLGGAWKPPLHACPHLCAPLPSIPRRPSANYDLAAAQVGIVYVDEVRGWWLCWLHRTLKARQ